MAAGRFLGFLAALLFGALTVSVLCVWLLLGTLSGSNRVLKTAAELCREYTSVEIDLRLKSGSLLWGFASDGPFKVAVPEVVTVSGDSLKVAWSLPQWLLNGALEAEEIKAPHLQVILDDQVFEGPSAPDDGEAYRVDIPVKALIRHFISENFAFRSQVVDVTAQSFDLSAACDGDYAGVSSGRMQGVSVTLHDQAAAPSETASPALLRSFGGAGIEKFATIDLPLDTEIRDLLIEGGRYSMQGFDTGDFDAYVSAMWRGHKLEVRRVALSHEWGHAALQGSMEFYAYFPMDFKAVFKGADSFSNCSRYAGALCALEGGASIKGDLSDLKVNALEDGPRGLKAQARLNALSSLLPLEAEVTAQSAAWPLWMPPELAGTPGCGEVAEVAPARGNEQNLRLPPDTCGVRGAGVKAAARGAIMDKLELEAQGAFTGYGFEDLKASAAALLDDFAPKLRSFKADGLYQGGALRAEAQNEDPEGPALFDGKLSFEAQNAAALSPLLSEKLAVSSKLTLADADGALQARAEDLDTLFTFEGRRAAFKARELSLTRDDGLKILLAKARLSSGGSALEADGELSESSDLQGRLEAGDLSELLPGLSGQAAGTFRVRGPLEAPEAEAVLRSPEISYGDQSAKELSLSARFSAAQRRGALTLLSDEVRLASSLQPSRRCALEASGVPENHTLSLNCLGSNSGFASVRGSFDAGKSLWSGTLSDLFLYSEFTDPLSLSAPAQLSFDLKQGQGKISPLKIRSKTGTLSTSEIIFGASGARGSADLENADLAFLSKFLPKGHTLEGSVSGHASFASQGGAPQAQGDFKVSGGRYVSDELRLRFDTFTLRTAFERDALEADLAAVLSRSRGGLDLSLKIADPKGRKALSGTVKLKGLALRTFSHLGGAFNELEGSADLRADLGGTLSKPLLNGALVVKGSAEPRYDVGRIDDFDLRLDAKGDHGDLKGTVSLNQGKAELAGALDWGSGAQGSVSLRAAKLPLFLAGYGNCLADLDLRAAFGDVLRIEGRADIPSARIKVQTLADSGTAPSPDEVLVGPEGTENLLKKRLRPQPPERSEINLELSLGDDVRVEAMGLKARAAGGVRLEKALTDRDVKASGKVELVDGRAELYGHRFLVSYAEADFDGKITNPKIRAEVIADPSGIEDDVTAGVRAEGHPADLQVKLFSRPAMSQNEILSYLLYGHGLEKSAEDPDSTSGQLLLALGLGTTTGLVNSISEALGVGGLQFGSSGTGDQTQVGVQGYLTSRIMISYGYGVFTSVGEFRLRYELMRKLYAEFVSSVDQAVDLIYSFEFN